MRTMKTILEGKDGRLRDARERNILTQAELAELSGVHWTTISKLEAGVATARPSTIRKLSKALGVTPQYLKGLTDDPVPDHSGGPLGMAVTAGAAVLPALTAMAVSIL